MTLLASVLILLAFVAKLLALVDILVPVKFRFVDDTFIVVLLKLIDWFEVIDRPVVVPEFIEFPVFPIYKFGEYTFPIVKFPGSPE
jgi:hypothetical protein